MAPKPRLKKPQAVYVAIRKDKPFRGQVLGMNTNKSELVDQVNEDVGRDDYAIVKYVPTT